MNLFSDKRHHYLRAFCLLTALLHIPYILWLNFKGWHALTQILYVTGPAYALFSFLLHGEKRGWVRHVVIAFFNLGVLAFALRSGRDSYVWTYFYSSMLLALAIFRHSGKSVATGVVAAFVGWIAFEWASQYVHPVLSLEQQQEFRRYALPAMVCIHGTCMYFVYSLFHLHARQLEKNIGELQQREESLLKNSRLSALGEVASGLVHEVNNALNIVVGQAALLRLKLKHDTALEEKVQRIETQAMRIAHMMKSLRRAGRSAHDSEAEWLEAGKILDSVLDLCKGCARRHDVKLEVHIEEDFSLEACEGKLTQALLNLTTNAIEAVEKLPERWVRVYARREGVEAVFRVVDSGTGLKPEMQIKILQPFFTTKGSEHGVGLGLSLVRSVAVEHEGRFQFDALAPHTTFVLRLPLQQTRRSLAA